MSTETDIKMTEDEWRATYYPIDAGDCSREDALDHSILKWEGLQKNILKKTGRIPTVISAGICALCSQHSTNMCATCPIKIHNGRTCAIEWRTWKDNNDAGPMLALLKLTKQKMKTTSLILDENFEYRTRSGLRAIYIDFKLNGEYPHLFIVKGADPRGGDLPITLGKELRFALDGEKSDLDIVDYYANWVNTQVDTKVFVRDFEDEEWLPRYFCKYENEKVYTFPDGATKFSYNGKLFLPFWKYAKLAD